VVLYDADCGFCTWVVDRLAGRVERGAIEIVALQSQRADDLLDGRVDEGAKWDSWHLVEPDGSLYSAGEAIPLVLRHVRGGRLAGRAASRFPRTTEALYRVVARNRDRLGRVVRADRCRVPGTR
jgi:predicted DCC family thiol-disulfide oxidoreductase YuxK